MTQPEEPVEKKSDVGRTHASETERIEALRARLYARGDGVETFPRHDLGTQHTAPEARTGTPPVAPQHEFHHDVAPLPTSSEPLPMPRSSARRSFRFWLAMAGILFFVGALIVSSVLLFSGKNSVSGSNISIDVAGPMTIGGGEAMNLQIAVSNQNTLPIESATLIVSYPRGAQSATEAGKELFTERQQLNNIGAGEVVNIPMKFLAYGEENEEKQVKVSVEYRVQGSNATFYKEALPFAFKISSSPIVVNVNVVDRISSGQEIEFGIVVQSNSKEALTNLLLRATYPQGFSFTSAAPETASGQDVWKIKSLKPGESYTLKIKGLVTGNENEKNHFSFAVGVANERDALSLASILATGESDILIEPPFLNVNVSVNGSTSDTVVIDPSSTARVNIDFKNALDTVVYDGVVLVELKGNALNEVTVRADDGFYDSTKNTVKWDSIDVNELRELAPGASHTVSFSVDPRTDIGSTPEIKLVVTIQGNRVSEGRSPEQVVGTIERTIKVSSITKLTSSALYSDGPFHNTGPTPPVAEKTTQYTYLLSVKNGTNPITGAEVTAAMPSYITWLDLVSDDSDVTYNPSTRSLKWNIGEMAAREYKEVWVQVSFLPSLSQVNTVPTILETQRFRATDRFTGTVVRTDAPALTTSLVNDPDVSVRDGRVTKN